MNYANYSETQQVKDRAYHGLIKWFKEKHKTKVIVDFADEGFIVTHRNPDLRDVELSYYPYAKDWNDGSAHDYFRFPLKVNYVDDATFMSLGDA